MTHLSVSDGDDIGGNVSGHVSGLGLDNGQGGEGSTTEVVVHLSRSLQQTGVQVEHITGVGLTTGGTTQQQGHLTVGNSLKESDKAHIFGIHTHQIHINSCNTINPYKAYCII